MSFQDWLGEATNWAEFSATTNLGVVPHGYNKKRYFNDLKMMFLKIYFPKQ